MGLRLVPRTIDAIRAGVRLAKFHAVDKPRLEREALEREERRRRDQAEQEERDRRRREEEVQQEEARAYARKKGEGLAVMELDVEARQKQLEHERRMLAVRERAEEIAREATKRRKAERKEWVGAIAAVADRFRRAGDG